MSEAEPDREGEEPEPLWRELVGRELHRERRRRGERLVDVAGRAGVSVQYLSEVERGIKEPSCEMIAAVAGALDTTLVDVTTGVVERLRTQRSATADRPTVTNSLAATRAARRRQRPSYVPSLCRSSMTWSTSPYSLAASAVKTRSWSVSARSVAMS